MDIPPAFLEPLPSVVASLPLSLECVCVFSEATHALGTGPHPSPLTWASLQEAQGFPSSWGRPWAPRVEPQSHVLCPLQLHVLSLASVMLRDWAGVWEEGGHSWLVLEGEPAALWFLAQVTRAASL